MTLLELMVATFLGLMLVGMCLSSVLANQRLFEVDMVRTRLNQNLRGAIDLVGSEIRQAGERLPSVFPVVEIVDGDAEASDELVLRRSLLDEVLTVCAAIESGDTHNIIELDSSDPAAPPACQYGEGGAAAGQQAAYAAWSGYRAAHEGSVKAYLYNLATKKGEFIDYVSEEDTGSSRRIVKSAGPFLYDYDPEISAVYILQEWRFRMDPLPANADILQIVENEDEENPLRVVFGVTSFQARALMQDGTSSDSFDASDPWDQLQAIEILMAGEDRNRKVSVTSELSARFFPRNILSQ